MGWWFRVRSARVGDPDREFDVPAVEVHRNPHLYVVLDPIASPVFRKPVIRPGVIRRKPAAAKKRRAKKPGEELTAPMGHDS